MSEQTTRLVARIRARLQHTVRRITYGDLAFGAGVAVGSILGIWLLAAALEAQFWFGTAGRMLIMTLVGAGAIGISAAVLLRPLGQLLGFVDGPSEEDVARAVGDHHPIVDDRLVNLLQLADGKRSHAPAPLVDEAVRNLAADLDSVSFEAVEDFSRARQALRLASLPLLGVIAFLILAPSTFLGASERLFAPGTEFSRPTPFQWSISPGNTRLVKGDTLQVSADVRGAVPESATLLVRDTTGRTERVNLQADSLGRFSHTIPNVRQPLRYRLVASPVRTDWYAVAISARPLVQQLQLTVVPPKYTGRSPRTLEPNVGDVSGLPGARVTVSAELGGPPVDTALLAFEGGPSDTLTVMEGVAEGAFTLRREGAYHVRLHDEEGGSNRNPIRYETMLESDAPPSASFLAPDSPTSLEADLRQPLRLQIGDDFGFHRAALFYRNVDADSGEASGNRFDSIEIPLRSPDPSSQTITYEWLLAQDTGLDPARGDEIAYYVKVWDNDTVNGPKSGRTRTQRLRMPSRSDLYNQLDQSKEATDRQIDDLQQGSDSARHQFEQLRSELRRTREADWQDQRQLKRIQDKQESLQRGAQSLSRQFENMTRQMQKDELSSPETAEQFKELQRIAEEMSSSDVREAMQKLKKALNQEDPREMQDALERVRRQQQQYENQLQRVQELFERLKAQQKLEEMAERSRNLAETQETLKEKTGGRMPDSLRGAQDRSREPDSSTPEGSSSDSTSTPSKTAPPRDSMDQAREAERSDSSAPDSSPPDSSQRSTSDATTPSADSDSTRSSHSSPQKNPANEDLAEDQKRAAEKMKELMEKMQEAEQQMEEVRSAPKKELRKMNEQLRRENLPKQMEQNSRQLRRNQLQEAREGQKQMQRRLQKMQQHLSQMQKGMKTRQQQVNITGLRTALENVLHLSEKQESLRTTVGDLAADGPVLRRYARDQKTLTDGLNTVTDSLESIARRVPQMNKTVQEETGRALQAMEAAITALDNRNSKPAVGHQKSSMMHLNELALLLSDLLGNMQQEGRGQGMSAQQMMQQLQEMSGRQQKLNRQIQKQLNQAQGERLSPNDAERRRELAKQQRNLREQLEEMDVGREAEDQILGDLKKIAEQMDASVEALQQGERREAIKKRQQQILTRLLNAQQSLRTQGKQEERRGEEANGDVPERTVGERAGPDETETLRRDLIRALEMGYSADYEELIRRYFDLLQNSPRPREDPPE